MLEHPLADRALVVLVLEARLLVEVHVCLRRAQVLADAAADAARQVLGVQRRVAVVLPHVDLVVALESERLEITIYMNTGQLNLSYYNVFKSSDL